MNVSLTIFKSKFDTDVSKRIDFKSFNEFEGMLYGLSKKRVYRKDAAKLISPATYITQDEFLARNENLDSDAKVSRKNVNVADWGGWAALDVDTLHDDNWKGLVEKKFSGLYYVCYNTASSVKSVPKFRLVFPLDMRVKAENIKPFWYALNSMAGNLGDRQTKDLSRMYYIPANYKTHRDSYNFIFTAKGDYVPVNELINKYPMPKQKGSLLDELPEAMRNEILQSRKSKLTKDFQWSSYRDCPFWPKQLEMEYRTIRGTGWYNQIYRMMVGIAGAAIKNGYPITSYEVAQLIREFDASNGNWYKKRPIEMEADRAVEFAYKENL